MVQGLKSFKSQPEKDGLIKTINGKAGSPHNVEALENRILKPEESL